MPQQRGGTGLHSPSTCGNEATARCRGLFPRCVSCENAASVPAVALRLKINHAIAHRALRRKSLRNALQLVPGIRKRVFYPVLHLSVKTIRRDRNAQTIETPAFFYGNGDALNPFCHLLMIICKTAPSDLFELPHQVIHVFYRMLSRFFEWNRKQRANQLLIPSR